VTWNATVKSDEEHGTDFWGRAAFRRCIGASLTVIIAMATGAEPVSLVKVLLILGLVGCIVGLKLVSDAGH